MLTLPARTSGQRHMRRPAPSLLPRRRTRGIHEGGTPLVPFAPLIDARAAGRLLAVPHTLLLAQARAGRIPHHRLGHYVRFNGDDLARWLKETRQGPLRAGESRVSR
jgi:excisionase family DNA binding protein